MTIEITDEIRAAFGSIDSNCEFGGCRDCLDERLAAVLAVFARDRCLEARGHIQHLPAKARCDARSGTFFCTLDGGHGDVHTASLGAGLGCSWS